MPGFNSTIDLIVDLDPLMKLMYYANKRNAGVHACAKWHPVREINALKEESDQYARDASRSPK